MLALLGVTLGLAACGGGGAKQATQPSGPASSTPPVSSQGQAVCGTSQGPTHYRHVVTIVLENHGFNQVDGRSTYLNRLAAGCGLATNYRAVTHPSLPNYLALTSGSTQGRDGSDCSPSPNCSFGSQSIFGQTGWQVFAEGMPSPCVSQDSGNYAARHNPPLYFTSSAVQSACAASDLPLGSPGSGPLHDALQSGLAPYTLIIPDLCHDEHDCPVATGDAWLGTWVPRILASKDYRNGSTVLFITYDEDDHNESNRVYTVVVSPSTPPGTQSSTAFDHYSMLRTHEELLGLPLLGAADGATSMRAAFGL